MRLDLFIARYSVVIAAGIWGLMVRARFQRCLAAWGGSVPPRPTQARVLASRVQVYLLPPEYSPLCHRVELRNQLPGGFLPRIRPPIG